MSAPQLELPNLNLTLGALYIGGTFSVFLFGIATLQTWLYYNSFSNDRLVLRTLVGGLWFLDLFHCICVTHAAYYYAISHYLDPLAFAFSTWSLDLGTIVTASVACTCQAFFTYRVWILGRNIFITTLCGGLCAARLALSIVTTWASFHVVGVAKYEAQFAWSIRAGLAIAAAGDVVIAVSMVYYLSSSRTGIRKTDKLISRLLTFTVETCLLTSTITVIDLICFVTMSGNFIFLGLYFIVAKLYTNSLLTSLNKRQTYRTNIYAGEVSNGDTVKDSRTRIQLSTSQSTGTAFPTGKGDQTGSARTLDVMEFEVMSKASNS